MVGLDGWGGEELNEAKWDTILCTTLSKCPSEAEKVCRPSEVLTKSRVPLQFFCEALFIAMRRVCVYLSGHKSLVARTKGDKTMRGK